MNDFVELLVILAQPSHLGSANLFAQDMGNRFVKKKKKPRKNRELEGELAAPKMLRAQLPAEELALL